MTRADDYLRPDGRWQYGSGIFEHQSFDDRDSAERALSFFKMNHGLPAGEEISEEEYRKLSVEYENRARKNKPPSGSATGQR